MLSFNIFDLVGIIELQIAISSTRTNDKFFENHLDAQTGA